MFFERAGEVAERFYQYLLKGNNGQEITCANEIVDAIDVIEQSEKDDVGEGDSNGKNSG